jgi:ABC-type oligopeptide transport system ATPase subunit
LKAEIKLEVEEDFFSNLSSYEALKAKQSLAKKQKKHKEPVQLEQQEPPSEMPPSISMFDPRNITKMYTTPQLK